MGAVACQAQEKHFRRKSYSSMGPTVILVSGALLLCCMRYSNGDIAVKTQKNELPKEKRKIVKLLLRNFPLEESASYHNLVEDDEAGQPIARGSSMTKYAPAYPYEETHISKLHKPVQKPEISKFEYALSSILLPPPKPAEPSVDEADVYYAPYMQWIQNYNPQPLPERLEVYQDLPQHDTQNLYEGPVNDYITSEEENLPPTYEN